MKRYIYLCLATLAVSAAIVLSGYMVRGSAVEAEIWVLQPQDMENTVTSSGKLQYRSGSSVKNEELGIIKEMLVNDGDSVSKGDVLFSYYAAEFASQYAEAGSLLNNLSVKEQVLEEAKKYCTVKEVTAPSAGRITGISCHTDDIVPKGTEVVHLADTDELEIPVNISENYIARIRSGQTANITFHAVPDKVYTGKVTKIAEEAVQTTGLSGKETTIAVTVTLDEKKDDLLRIGYSADCSIVTSVDKSVLVIPYEYLRSDEEGDYVLSAVRGRAKKIAVTLGKEYQNGAAVLSGIQENAPIIKNAEITDGQAIIMKP